MNAAPAAPARALPEGEREALFWRSMLIQAGWNFEGMQNLGFLYALEPGLARVHRDPESLKRAQMRHLGFFNTQPYMAGFALGACLGLEEDVARATADTDEASAVQRVERLKRALGSALAALGDPFYWGVLRPATAAWTLVAWTGLWTLGAPAPVAFGTALGLAAFNAPALWTRWVGPRLGYERGEALPAELKRLGWPEKAVLVRRVGLLGAALASGAALAVPPFGGTPSWWNAAALAAAFGLRVRGYGSPATYAALLLASAVLAGAGA
jgi:PTS system mannose-specific IID component